MPVKTRVGSYHWGEKLEGELIAEAVKMVEPLGITSLSAREVARVVGVSHAAPAHYFPDRLTLAAAVGAVGFERLYLALVDGLAANTGSPSEKLIVASQTYVAFALKKPGLYRTMYAPQLAEILKTPLKVRGKGFEHVIKLAEQRRRVFSIFIETIEYGQAKGAFVSGRPDSLARVSMAVCFGIARDYLDGGLMFRGDRESHVRNAMGVILKGLESR